VVRSGEQNLINEIIALTKRIPNSSCPFCYVKAQGEEPAMNQEATLTRHRICQSLTLDFRHPEL
jgi:hypothetical protein